MSKFVYSLNIKQHTPLIHFQSSQAGATLRATELKPKLDRFLLQKVKDLPCVINANGHRSLEYKVKINSTNTNISIPKAYVKKSNTDPAIYQAPYFADAHKSVMSVNTLQIEFFSYNSQLLEAIKEYIDYFFVYENFGTRQSKGFGSFTRADISDAQINKILAAHENPVFVLGTCKAYKDAFIKIDSFYKKLKMGINKPYFKSLLFRYMCDTYKIGWEKKFIKQNFPEVIHGEHQPLVCRDDREFRYIRALLGLAEHNEFRPNGGKKQVRIKSKDGIERFKSPLIFKVIHSKIYILFNKSYQDIMDREFTFSLGKKSADIKTPSQFDMYEFLKFVAKHENVSEVK
ncbi:hypothetical protein LCX93_04880 [Sulfurimonas sp. SWIR-19]|uniref:hypothetical protein n=1 Tax=Sulfurimonas sp. SWIR-19 TaxID=2878390 RepID=UPI001CF1FC24|nr:hypothetical protein [Sulfurimonas sp. SWIR-19]UCN01252.1 hypothetical protein LCX93_04880 [Sulfurimonas sp. SWIR-19]